MLLTELVIFGAAAFGCAMAAANLDRRGRRIALWSGAVIAVLAGIFGGSTLSGEWQDILVWLHSVPFGATDPVFHADYSFFVFTLPAIVLQPLTGLALALSMGYPLGSSWIVASSIAALISPTPESI